MIDKLISGTDMMARNELVANVSDSFQQQRRDMDPKSLPLELDGNKASCKNELLPQEMRRRSSGTSVDIDLSDLKGSCLYQIPLPADMPGRSYGSLYKRLSKRGIVPLGLLRGSSSPSEHAPYVYTNPSYDTELSSYDFVFILSVQPIKDGLEEASPVRSMNLNNLC